MTVPRFRLFILGAGFSQPAKLPLGPELLDEVRSRVRAVFRRHEWDGPLEKEIAEWEQLYPGSQLNLESVFAYSHRKHYLGLIGSDEFFEHGSRSIVEARRAIQEVLMYRLLQSARYRRQHSLFSISVLLQLSCVASISSSPAGVLFVAVRVVPVVVVRVFAAQRFCAFVRRRECFAPSRTSRQSTHGTPSSFQQESP